jgi:hypothetical protein
MVAIPQARAPEDIVRDVSLCVGNDWHDSPLWQSRILPGSRANEEAIRRADHVFRVDRAKCRQLGRHLALIPPVVVIEIRHERSFDRIRAEIPRSGCQQTVAWCDESDVTPEIIELLLERLVVEGVGFDDHDPRSDRLLQN